MGEDATVTAADIARLGGVGRAAVSNWRRRHRDFPDPVGGTAASPRFSLRAVQHWLIDNDKVARLPIEDQTWQRLRAVTDDLELGRAVVSAGAFLLSDGGDPADLPGELPGDPVLPVRDRQLRELLTELAATCGSALGFETLCRQYTEAHSRQLAATPVQVVALMVRLLTGSADGGALETVQDPACGIGTLLLATRPASALAQDSNPTSAAITALRLRFAGVETTAVAADTLRHPRFTGRLADAVICDPPFNERGWGHQELLDDPRWVHGMPPRGESELAWIQHCLAAVRPGGPVVVLMPQAAASRRSGRRIRANLLRAGALRAVLSLPSGQDVWCLRRPRDGDPSPVTVQLLECADPVAAAARTWQDAEHAVPILDLLDDQVDVSPAHRRLHRERADLGAAYRAVHASFDTAQQTLTRHRDLGLDVLADRRHVPTSMLGELARSGAVTITHGAESGQPGDVVADPTGSATVLTADTDLTAHQVRYRPDPELLDPEFLAGVLRTATATATHGSSRIDARRTTVPRLPIDEQRAYGAAFRRLDTLRAAAHELASVTDSLASTGLAGLVDGHLAPGHR